MTATAPSYLVGHLTENASSYEVRNAPVAGFSVVKKTLGSEEITLYGLPDQPAGKYYKVKMAGSQIDRHLQRFLPEVIEKYANDINREGLSLNFGHDQKNLIGKVTKAVVENGDLMGFVWVDELAMMPNQPKMSVAHAIEAGILKEVSVEVSGSLRIGEKDAKGFATSYEWYIDPEAPERTEIHGLALVQRGAQRGAALSVKAAGETTIQPKTIVRNMKEVFVINGKKHFITGKTEGTEIVVEGLKEVENAITELEATANKSVQLESDLAVKSAEIASLRAPFEADIINGQKALGIEEPMTEEAVKSLNATDLVSKSKSILERLEKKGEGVSTKSVTTKLPWQA